MYKKPKYQKTMLTGAKRLEGETIENKVTRLIKNKEPIKDGAPPIYTERKEGVNSAYNIRTDRWELATDLMDKVTRGKIAKRDEIIKKEEDAKVIKMEVGKPESTDGKQRV